MIILKISNQVDFYGISAQIAKINKLATCSLVWMSIYSFRFISQTSADKLLGKIIPPHHNEYYLKCRIVVLRDKISDSLNYFQIEI